MAASAKHILFRNQGELRAFKARFHQSEGLHWKVVWPCKWLHPSWAAQTCTQLPKGRAKHERSPVHKHCWSYSCLLSCGLQRAKQPTRFCHGLSLWISIIGKIFFLKTKKSQQSLPSSHQQKVKTLRRTAFSCHMLPSKSWVSLCTLTVISHIDMAAKRGLFDVLSCLCNGVSF